MKKIELEYTPSSIYLMHKYWGKKPSKDLRNIIEKYTKKGDILLDPFSGFGGLGIEGVLLERNVILNDLNPVANFISSTILNLNIDIQLFESYYKNIRKQYCEFLNKWYTFNNNEIITILRNKNDIPLKLKLYNKDTKKMFEYKLSDLEKDKFIKEEKQYKIKDWYPNKKLIINSRISAKENMRICDLFSKRELICHAYLYGLIEKLDESSEKELFKLAFTSNLANCSKLVPPITSRGEMSQGAWMTGFYIAEKYLENNVFHYFENRVNKVLKGKKEFISLVEKKKKIGTWNITNYDAKNLKIDKEKIDFVFTDFPYGDTVPYFEQSQIWNAWLKYEVDYDNEIVVSNSSERNKNDEIFAKDIEKSIKEINRVLKNQSYFVFTFHSLNGNEWKAISNSLLKYNFEFVDCQLLLQKTFTPRQLNRKFTVKGDLLVIYKKNKERKQTGLKLDDIQKNIKKEILKKCNVKKLYDTNDLITLCVKCLLKYNYINNNIDFFELIKEFFEIDKKDEKKWRLKNEI